MIITYAQEKGLTESNVKKIVKQAIKYMRNNAILEEPDAINKIEFSNDHIKEVATCQE